MADFQLTLGDMNFEDAEVPQSAAVWRRTGLVVHRMVGGVKSVQAMGGFSLPKAWDGWLRGPSPLQRARYLETMCEQGQPLALSWSELMYIVVIRTFRADFQRFYQMPYSIELEVVENLNQPVRSLASPSVDSLVSEDMNTAGGLVDELGLSGITEAFGAVTSAISQRLGHGLFPGQRGPVDPEQRAAADRGVAARDPDHDRPGEQHLDQRDDPGRHPAEQPYFAPDSVDLEAVVATQQLPMLINLDRVMGRVQGNIGSIHNSARRDTVAGGNLMTMASKLYGDAMAWTGLAKANNLSDPQVSGVQQ
ncbi:hypothetical protein [Cupriavidus sp. USMAA2-4]|uniref:hypothetical protein n=1 Tax=Cupriavidus sp. USMAA2-4 TaxID=876364 RepID=UPI001E3C76A1|nr:hypothetical protein [Cupriavidus sp. USMAA2-4]